MAIFILNGKGNKKGAMAQRRKGVTVLIRSLCLSTVVPLCHYAFAPLGLFY
jgi:hypothetical protein